MISSSLLFDAPMDISDPSETDRTLIRISYVKKNFRGNHLKSVVQYHRCEEISNKEKNTVEILSNNSLHRNEIPLFLEDNSSNSKEITDSETTPLSRTHILQRKKYQTSNDSFRRQQKKLNSAEHRNQSFIKHQRKGIHCFYTILNILGIFFLGLVISRYVIAWLSTERISLTELQNELSTKILYQDGAIAVLCDSLKKLDEPGTKNIITSLVGSSGIGKTFAVNIIKKHVDLRVIHSFEPSDLSELANDKSDIFRHLRWKIMFSDYSLIVLDNLIVSDLEELIHLIDNISKIEHEKVLILVIFSIQTADNNLNFSMNYNDIFVIEKKLGNLTQNFYLAKFEELNETVVALWLKNELIARNIDKNYHEQIIREMMFGLNVRYHGLKGMHPKLSIQLDKFSLIFKVS